jgi:hypothetical protein
MSEVRDRARVRGTPRAQGVLGFSRAAVGDSPAARF